MAVIRWTSFAVGLIAIICLLVIADLSVWSVALAVIVAIAFLIFGWSLGLFDAEFWIGDEPDDLEGLDPVWTEEVVDERDGHRF